MNRATRLIGRNEDDAASDGDRVRNGLSIVLHGMAITLDLGVPGRDADHFGVHLTVYRNGQWLVTVVRP